MEQALDAGPKKIDSLLVNTQKALLAALVALAPMTSLIIDRGDEDSELNDLAANAVHSIQALASGIAYLNYSRKENVKQAVQADLLKDFGKEEDLFGGNLQERVTKSETLQKLSDKLSKRKPKSQPKTESAKKARTTGQFRPQGQLAASRFNYYYPRPAFGGYHQGTAGGARPFRFPTPAAQPHQQRPRFPQQQQPQQTGQRGKDFLKAGTK